MLFGFANHHMNIFHYFKMGIDEDLISVLRDLVQFLEDLCEVNLPIGVENVRTDLLQRSKLSLEAQNQRSISPEPYLTMKAGKGKGLILPKLIIPNDDNVTEYIDPEDQSSPINNRSSQVYYEWFSDSRKSSEILIKEESDDEDTLLQIYRSYSTEITKNQCRKCGTVKQKDERMIIGLFGNRSYWLGLIGSHLLVYPSENEKQPNEVYSIRDYSARPAPNSMPRDPKQGKSAFEVFSPGCKTLVFIAKSPSDMEEWVAAICKSGPINNSLSNSETFIESNSNFGSISTNSDEQYHDVGIIEEKVIIREKPKETNDLVKYPAIEKSSAEKSKINQYTENVKLKNEKIPIPVLPARNPRRLPPLPQENSSTYEPLDDNYDGDGIYHKIEELRSSKIRNTTYQNLDINSKEPVKKLSSDLNRNDEEYDDIQAAQTKSHSSENFKKGIITYDDIKSTDIKKNSKEIPSPKKKKLFSRSKRDSPKKQIDQKDPVKKESEKKKDKKKSSLIEASHCEPIIFQELPTYDDISDFPSELKHQDIDQGNYNSPPAPRPIFIKPLELGEMYDDISQLRVSNEQVTSYDEMMHYQVPRSQETIDPGQLTVTVKEELYDDIAILAEARSRQRDSGCSSSSYEKTGNNVVRALSRLASGKRLKFQENSIEKTDNFNKSKGDEFDDINGHMAEQNDVFKFNKFKKLVNKIEFSLNGSAKPLTIGNKNHDSHEIK